MTSASSPASAADRAVAIACCRSGRTVVRDHADGDRATQIDFAQSLAGYVRPHLEKMRAVSPNGSTQHRLQLLCRERASPRPWPACERPFADLIAKSRSSRYSRAEYRRAGASALRRHWTASGCSTCASVATAAPAEPHDRRGSGAAARRRPCCGCGHRMACSGGTRASSSRRRRVHMGRATASPPSYTWGRRVRSNPVLVHGRTISAGARVPSLDSRTTRGGRFREQRLGVRVATVR